MKHATLCLLIDKKENRILLGMKKRGFGSGKFNGFGGKVEQGERIVDAASRELFEESGVKVLSSALIKSAELSFRFPHKPEWDQVVHVFTATSWEGLPVESDEMLPEWFALDKIPFHLMWDDDKHWLPFVLRDKFVRGRFSFDEKSDLTLIEELRAE